VRPAARLSALGAFFLLIVAGLIRQADTRELSATSFGSVPAGHGALYQLLAEAGLPVARSFASPDQLAPQRTIWWIEPSLSREKKDARPPSLLAGEAFAHWIEQGGRAVVLLGAPSRQRVVIAGVALPELDAEMAPDARDDPVRGDAAAPQPALVAGPLAPRSRTLALLAPVAFAEVDPADWRTLAKLDGKPFVLERALGTGRLAVVADARFLTNGWLDRADAAPFVLDLVRAYGVPWIDEHEHGLVASRGALRYLAGSPALPFFGGLALLGLGFAWFGAALPARRVQERDPNAPTLETFVASLASLYAATRDYPRVLARYRELTARKLRRHFGLPPDAPLGSLSERLARRRSVSTQGLALLVEGATPRDAAELELSVALLDRLAREARA